METDWVLAHALIVALGLAELAIRLEGETGQAIVRAESGRIAWRGMGEHFAFPLLGDVGGNTTFVHTTGEWLTTCSKAEGKIIIIKIRITLLKAKGK